MRFPLNFLRQDNEAAAADSLMREEMGLFTSVVVLLPFVIFILRISEAVDTITANQQIKDGDTMVSAGGSFELGFTQLGSSGNRYLGIWYKEVSPRTVVWVANRDEPVNGSAGVLKLTDRGSLVILDGSGKLIWSSNSTGPARNPAARLLDSGNLVITSGNDEGPDKFRWQSFDYPGDTLLPGMKQGRNMAAGRDWSLTSWKSSDDPSKGEYTYGFDPSGYPQLFLKSGSDVIFRPGPWNGVRFSGFPELRPNPVFNYSFVFNEKEMYFTYKLVNSSVLSRLVLNPKGNVQRSIWIGRTNRWTVYSTAYKDDCDSYALCGAYSTCNINRSPRCRCMDGFVPRFPHQWEMMDWSNGCVRETSLDCRSGDKFVKYSGVKLPDTRSSWFNGTMNMEGCEGMCLRNCSCTAYTSSDIRGGGSGCLLWFGGLVDVREFTENGQDLYIRMAASELDQDVISKGKKTWWIVVGAVSIVGMILLSLVALYVQKKRTKRKGTIRVNNEGSETNERQEDLELPLFDLDTILIATNHFSMNNKLGEGGFGPVYKGMLQDGKEIAVKRLSKESKQGLDEFKNEVIHISKLQHRNLVKLLGCCIHGEEKVLIYEYMPNKSLDFFIFDQAQSIALDWSKRFVIINGIARGLLYLHQDSRFRIIHRDLKADNVLLDHEMNPRISDFGMARSFGGNETLERTKRVVGTYGYMSPEYAIDGIYSVKSDVFSFGVLVLEIISGKRNRGFYHPDHDLNLLGHAWTLYMEGTPLELTDSSVKNMHNPSEVLRAINVGLLCVQRHPDDRPNMSSVVLMLSSEGALPQPKEPGFFTERNVLGADSSQSKHMVFSGSEHTITIIEGR